MKTNYLKDTQVEIDTIINLINKIPFNYVKKIIIPKSQRLSNLCSDINIILYENHKLFIQNNPALNFQSNGQVEIDNWILIQSKKINPNNQKILELINNNKDLIPIDKKDLFLKFEQHVISFENHVRNRTFDYSNHQFPKDFAKYICKNAISQQKNNQLQDILKWLKVSINHDKYNTISQIYIYGSIFIYAYKNIEDIDIILYFDNFNNQNMNEFEKFKNKLKTDFNKKFKKELHITVFNSKEKEDLEQFISRLYLYRSLSL